MDSTRLFMAFGLKLSLFEYSTVFTNIQDEDCLATKS